MLFAGRFRASEAAKGVPPRELLRQCAMAWYVEKAAERHLALEEESRLQREVYAGKMREYTVALRAWMKGEEERKTAADAAKAEEEEARKCGRQGMARVGGVWMDKVAAPCQAEDGEAACVTCRVQRRDVTLLPCGHYALCRDCLVTMVTRERVGDFTCPLCRKAVDAAVRTIHS